ncbi:hypothetical protein BU23DRAFT_652449 [Bimuria novae-zelandiae CBS 107.79]|uniref:Uncharacterized protein n=1 Tax=Bimuria novae-zelandiae CBS 107.79 TaxID=1447943 RepID=A0A6A5UWZ4_9PLEO|nr:hypothetical protein BU23DRAFT_652449 [Bimuria novae-zelandiae CBS 107.79]
MYNGDEALPLGLMGCMFPFADDLDSVKYTAQLCAERFYQDGSGQWQCHDSRWPYKGDEITEPGILINNIFRRALKSSFHTEYLNGCFTLAVTLVNQIAQAAHSFPHFRYVDPKCHYWGAAFSSHNEMLEIVDGPEEERVPSHPGYSWERSLFGGCKAADPLQMLEYSFRMLKTWSASGIIAVSSPEDITKWFQKEH